MKRHRAAFDKRGLLAMRADFWGMFFGVEEQGEDFELRGDVAIVDIQGPLTHHADWFWDSYDAIKGRVASALASSAKTVALRIDSPGGDVSGCFETVREIRALAASSGKRIVSYADGMAASAGYALACAGDAIYLPATGFVGSIGVISTLFDMTELDRKIGLNFAVIASGQKKRYGHPNVPISDAAIANAQGQVDELAELFFALVSEARGVSVEAIRSLEAGMAIGAQAVAAKLADRVCTFDELLEDLSSGNTAKPTGGAAEGKAMGWKDEMKKAAEDGDEDAKKALEALEEPPPSSKQEPAKGEGDGGSDDDQDKDKPKPQGEEPKKDDEQAAARGRVAPVASLADRVAAIETDRERDRLLASRPDMPKELRKKLASAPIETVRWNVENLPKVASATAGKQTAPSGATATTSPLAHANAITPPATRGANEGDGEGGGVSRRSEHAADLDVRMGLAAPPAAIRNEGTRLVLGVITPAQARAEMARREKEGAK